MSRVDLVVFGATGFTGRHAAARLARLAPARGLRWAVAGRSGDKLSTLLQEIARSTGIDQASTPVLLADVQDEQSVREMCARARVLVNCCGPYTLYGEVVVKACIDSGTHYVDVTAESMFVEGVQLRYDAAARAAGVYVVSACGFESIPADVGVLYLQQHFGGVLNSVEVYVAPDIPSHSVNYGTWHSLIYILAHLTDMPAIRKQLYPTPLPKFTPELKYRMPFHRRNGGWCLPFPCNDSATVYRTQRYFYERDGTRPAHVTAYVKFTSLLTAIAIALTAIYIFILSQFKMTRKLLLNHYQRFSLGVIVESPAEEVVEGVGYEFVFYGSGWDESEADRVNSVPPRKTVIAKISGKNPGYGLTVWALLFSALALLEEQHSLPPGGGIMTPGIAFAKTNLIKNLQENGVKFEIVKNKVHED